MVPFVVLLCTQIYSIKMRSSKLIIKGTTQKIMVKFGFGCRFHGLKQFKVDFILIFFISCFSNVLHKIKVNI